MLLPTLLLALAVLAAGVVGYGMNAAWAAVPHGLTIIEWSRRLEWPAAGLAVLLCVAVVAMVAGGRRRAWWLIGLLPVLALFVHRFVTGPDADWQVADNPPLVSADAASSVGDGDWVVGVLFGDGAYAYPYAALFHTPAVVQVDRERRLLLLWSAYANRAVAFTCDRSIVPRELDLVSTPADGLLVYDGRAGQFISGITGLTSTGQRPTGLREPVQTYKMTWADWRRQHPATRVFVGDPRGRSTLAAASSTSTADPRLPLSPTMPLPRAAATQPSVRVVLVAATQPAAVPQAVADGATVANFSAGDTRVLLVPDVVGNGVARAFDRRVKEDLFPRFTITTSADKRGPMLQDVDSQSLWTLDGKAVSGPLKGEQLRPLVVDDQLDYRVLKFWLPALPLVTPEPPPTIAPPTRAGPEGVKPPHRKRTKRPRG